MRLDEYFRDPHPPPVQDLVVVGFAVVRDHLDRVLLVRRSDDGNWELPGGQVEVGETVAAAVIREVAEESGVSVDLTGVSGIYSDPTHIVVYSGGARQQCALCFHARPDPPVQEPRPDDDETVEAVWFTPAEARELTMHPDVRRRLMHAVDHPDTTHVD
jgi:8-oxo-dGTP pyrophosphatase MutT (NUDIX family)